MIVNDDTGTASKENLDVILKAYEKYPYGLLPRGKSIPAQRAACREDVDHEQVERHEKLYDPMTAMAIVNDKLLVFRRDSVWRSRRKLSYRPPLLRFLRWLPGGRWQR